MRISVLFYTFYTSLNIQCTHVHVHIIAIHVHVHIITIHVYVHVHLVAIHVHVHLVAIHVHVHLIAIHVHVDLIAILYIYLIDHKICFNFSSLSNVSFFCEAICNESKIDFLNELPLKNY